MYHTTSMQLWHSKLISRNPFKLDTKVNLKNGTHPNATVDQSKKWIVRCFARFFPLKWQVAVVRSSYDFLTSPFKLSSFIRNFMIHDKLHKSTKILGKNSSKQAPSQITFLTCFNFITFVLCVEFFLMDNFSRTLDKFFTLSGFLNCWFKDI